MAEDSSPHRLRRVLYLLVLGAAAWAVVRTRAATAAADAPEVAEVPEAPPAPVAPPAPPVQAAPPAVRAAPPARPAPAPAQALVDSPTTELPVVDAPGGRTARRRAALAEMPGSAAPALPDGSPPGPGFTIKAKS